MESDIELNPEFIAAYDRVMASLDNLIKRSSEKKAEEKK